MLGQRAPARERAPAQELEPAQARRVAAGDADPELPAVLAGRVEPDAWRTIARIARRGFAAPVTTSMGRLFDAVAALCGLRTHATYEGQAAIELEALADRAERGAYALPVGADGRLDARAAVLEVAAEARAGTPVAIVSARFHRAVAQATAQACEQAAGAAGTELVVLSGGVFQNRLLLQDTAARLEACGLRVLVPERVPPNDGGISFGQAAIAAARGQDAYP